jgi:hypothetical protein
LLVYKVKPLVSPNSQRRLLVTRTDSLIRTPPRVSVRQLVLMLGGPAVCGLQLSDFQPAGLTEYHRWLLAQWRVDARPIVPRLVAEKLIAQLIERAQ